MRCGYWSGLTYVTCPSGDLVTGNPSMSRANCSNLSRSGMPTPTCIISWIVAMVDLPFEVLWDRQECLLSLRQASYHNGSPIDPGEACYSTRALRTTRSYPAWRVLSRIPRLNGDDAQERQSNSCGDLTIREECERSKHRRVGQQATRLLRIFELEEHQP